MLKTDEILFLLFNGGLENEGIFSALETEKDIIILSAGGDAYLNVNENENINQQLGLDYLKSKKNKIKAIVLNNSDYRKIGILDKLLAEIGWKVPIFVSYQSKLVIQTKFSKLANNFNFVLFSEEKEYKIDNFSFSFIPCNSYLVGNLGIHCRYFDYSFFYFEDFYHSPLLKDELFSKNNFFLKLQELINKKKEKSYLITSSQSIHWYNDNSFFFLKNNLPLPNFEILFFLFYDFDWMHIIEFLEIVFTWKKRVCFLNQDFFNLLKRILTPNNHLRKIIFFSEIKEELSQDAVYLFVTNSQKATVSEIEYVLHSLSREKRKKLHFVVCLPPSLGGENKFASLLDYLWEQSDKITNFSKKQKHYFRLGTSYSDTQVLINLIKPLATIILNNSYKNKEINSFLDGKIITPGSNHYLDFRSNKSFPLNLKKKNLIDFEDILEQQKKKIKDCGLLIVCLFIKEIKKNEEIELQSVYFERIAIAYLKKEDEKKMEEKIKKWWKEKLVNDLPKDFEQFKNLRGIIEKRLNGFLKSFICYKWRQEPNDVAEITIFIFNR